jgi:predicted anti-sigma-YlaC factor YlaD
VNCQEINPKLYLLADGELMDSEMQEVKAHLAECADCRILLVSLESENEILSDAARVSLWEPERLLLLEDRLFRHIRPNRRRWAGVAFRKQILAFVSALMLIIGGVMQTHGDRSILAHSISRLQTESSRLLRVGFQWNQQIIPKTP